MPVIEVRLADLRELLGAEVNVDELSDRLPMMGTEWKGMTEEGFQLEVFPNRPDLLSIEGLARAYAYFTERRTSLVAYEVRDSDYAVHIDRKVEGVRPYFVTAVVKNIEFDDALIRSIIQMQEKLHVTHGRRRRKVAIGLHNLKPIRFPVTYTTKPPGFRFRPLGERFEMSLTQILAELHTGRDYGWIVEGFEEYPMILDAKGMVLSMPPIINGEYTRIDEATRDIFIDVTGTDMKAITEALNIIVTTFADRGAEIFSLRNHYPNGEVTTPDLSSCSMKLDNSYVVKNLGVELSPEDTARYLKMMGHEALPGEILTVNVPSYRTDIMHPIDLVEDVAIAYGYDNFVPTIPKIASQAAGENPIEVFSRGLRNFLVGLGLQEVVTFMMTNEGNLFERMCLPQEPVAETENPKTNEYTVLRNRLLPSLMEVLSLNKHHPYPQNLFEVDDVVLIDEVEERGARTARRLAVALCHGRANFSEAKAVMNSILDNLGLTKVETEEGGPPCFIDGRRLVAGVDGKPLCWAGELRPEALEMWGLEMPVSALEMDVDALFEFALKGED